MIRKNLTFFGSIPYSIVVFDDSIHRGVLVLFDKSHSELLESKRKRGRRGERRNHVILGERREGEGERERGEDKKENAYQITQLCDQAYKV